uniref:Phospholipase DDHD1-like n=1 Tax=Saccoglossus kowalevskii TaxID=10224 RepID=A0ABM0LW22_SACKO|nr:PREDICTED: phospholipase DDHD1-like [Saccoglossus kowalevskii]
MNANMTYLASGYQALNLDDDDDEPNGEEDESMDVSSTSRSGDDEVYELIHDENDDDDDVTPVDNDPPPIDNITEGTDTVQSTNDDSTDDSVIVISDDSDDGGETITKKDDDECVCEKKVEHSNAVEGDPLTGGEQEHFEYDQPKRREQSTQVQAPDIIQDLNAREVRWFYRENKEDRKWTHFIGYDSLRVEWKYREIHFHNTKTHDTIEMIIVRGGLYEVDVVTKKCYPIYWEAEAVDVMRGTWFVDGTWQPIDESMAEELEESHLEKFRGQNKNEPPETLNIKGKVPILHNIRFKDSHVDWNSLTEIYFYSDKTSSKLARSIGTSIGLSKASSSGTRLHRGYCLEAALDDKPPPISHLVFVIHGIGQKMDSSCIIKSCTDLRTTTQKMVAKHFPSLASATSTKRVEFLPVEWRSVLKLDGDMVDCVTPHRLRGLRSVLNSSAMDIMYYTSPLFRSEIVRGLQRELNRLYKMFCERNEGFEANDGRVSVISHSLGAVIVYDILTGWNPIHLYDQYLIHEHAAHPDLDTVDKEHEELARELSRVRERVGELESQLLSTNQVAAVTRMPTLNFKVDNMFCLGSPLAVFLVMRGVRPHGKGKQDMILPKSQCKRLFNIYHPADPVAYRIEPLLIKHYSTIMPLKINNSDALKQKRYSKMTMMAYPSAKDKPKEMISSGASAMMQDVTIIDSGPKKVHVKKSSFWSKWSKKTENVETDPQLQVLESMKEIAAKDEVEVVEKGVPVSVESVELEYRIDFELREGSMENAYISALTSHTSYWTSADVVLFVLAHLFPDYMINNES